MSEEKRGNIFCKAFLLLFRRFLGFYDVIGLQQVLWLCLPLAQLVAVQIDSWDPTQWVYQKLYWKDKGVIVKIGIF